MGYSTRSIPFFSNDIKINEITEWSYGIKPEMLEGGTLANLSSLYMNLEEIVETGEYLLWFGTDANQVKSRMTDDHNHFIRFT